MTCVDLHFILKGSPSCCAEDGLCSRKRIKRTCIRSLLKKFIERILPQMREEAVELIRNG